MENNDNNNLSELDQLKAQYETLKQQFDQQEIVNDRLMKSSIKSNVDFYMRYRWKQYLFYPVALLCGLLITKWEFGNSLSLRLFWMSYCLVSFAVEMWMLRKLHVKTIENNDLLTLSNQARRFKKLFTLFTILSAVPMLILSVGLFAHTGYDHFPSFGRFLAVLCFTLVFFVGIGVIGFRHVTRPCDDIIQKIEASENPTDKRTGFGSRQKWFCVAMFVMFLGLDVWAYMIVASHLKLPPTWHNKKYVRPANDLSSEGTLEFWEVYADTLVAEEDVPIVTENWQQGDSLVVMRSNCQSDPVETRQGTSLLYALKKTTPEGSAISSAVMHGKPLVAYVACTHPRRNPNGEPVQLFVFLTSEARQLWYRFTTEIVGHRTAIVMDGVVIQDWQVMCGIENGKFMIMREWSSKEELEAFCERLIKQ
ncbi:MAG: hypothetical protein IKN08_05755 [Bacteroidales bacterium]|nr:hypothetical protein [Bacteroidales bacterium]